MNSVGFCAAAAAQQPGLGLCITFMCTSLIPVMWCELLACHAGINSVVFYAPVLFSSLGMGQDSALLSSVITGAVFVAATVISILTVDTFGRKVHPFCAHIAQASTRLRLHAETYSADIII